MSEPDPLAELVAAALRSEDGTVLARLRVGEHTITVAVGVLDVDGDSTIDYSDTKPDLSQLN